MEIYNLRKFTVKIYTQKWNIYTSKRRNIHKKLNVYFVCIFWQYPIMQIRFWWETLNRKIKFLSKSWFWFFTVLGLSHLYLESWCIFHVSMYISENIHAILCIFPPVRVYFTRIFWKYTWTKRIFRYVYFLQNIHTCVVYILREVVYFG